MICLIFLVLPMVFGYFLTVACHPTPSQGYMSSVALLFFDFFVIFKCFFVILLPLLWFNCFFLLFYLWFFGYLLTCAWCGDWMGALLHTESNKNSTIYSDSYNKEICNFYCDIGELRPYQLGEYFPHRVQQKFNHI